MLNTKGLQMLLATMHYQHVGMYLCVPCEMFRLDLRPCNKAQTAVHAYQYSTMQQVCAANRTGLHMVDSEAVHYFQHDCDC